MRKLITIFFSRIVFRKIKKKKFLIIDKNQSFIFQRYLPSNDVNILEIRYESLNLFILLKIFLKFKFSFKDYMLEYIKCSGSEYIITYMDNHIFNYKIKKYFPEKKIIIIQNGSRLEFFFENLSTHNDLKADYLFTLSEEYKERFQKHVQGKIIVLGSFKNNLIKKTNNTKLNILSYISDFTLPIKGKFMEKSMIKIYDRIIVESDLYYKPERLLLPKLVNFCKSKNLKLQILARSKNSENLKNETNFYESIINKKDFKIIDNSKDYSLSYKYLDESKLNVNIQSVLGLESIARGNRTAIFNVRNEFTKIESLNSFWSSDFKLDKGSFWTDELLEKEINRVLEFLFNAKESIWQNDLKKLVPKFISFNQDNQKFKDTLK